jgi:hypothetical protein
MGFALLQAVTVGFQAESERERRAKIIAAEGLWEY